MTEAASAGTDSIQLDSTGTAFTIPATDDFAGLANIEKIIAVASANAYSITLKADADTDAAALRTIDLSGDTNTTGTNVVVLSNVSGTYTVIGSAGIDQITGSVGVDYIDVSAASNDVVTIAAAADTGIATAGAASTATTTIDVIKVEAGDKVDVTGIVATDASFDTLDTITESGNLSLTVNATASAQARGIYDAVANTFTHATAAAGANAVMVSFAATDAGTTATDSLILLGVTSITDFEKGIFTI